MIRGRITLPQLISTGTCTSTPADEPPSRVPSPQGLGVSCDGERAFLVRTSTPSFWAAAPVIELRAQLGGECPGDVHFRVRVDQGALEVVGEIDAPIQS